MDTGKAIFYGLALIALAIVATEALAPAARAASGEVGRYMIAGRGEKVHAWVIDTVTGHYRLCNLRGECDRWLDGGKPAP